MSYISIINESLGETINSPSGNNGITIYQSGTVTTGGAVLQYTDFASFPQTGVSDNLYIDLNDSNKQYIWNGSAYETTGGGGVDPDGVRNTVLSGLSLINQNPITNSNTILEAMGNLQSQISFIDSTAFKGRDFVSVGFSNSDYDVNPASPHIAMINAIAEAKNRGHGNVWIKDGIYTNASAVVNNISTGVSIYGSSPNTVTWRVSDGGSNNAFSAVSGSSKIKFQGFTIDGNGLTRNPTLTAGNTAISITGVDWLNFTDMKFINTANFGTFVGVSAIVQTITGSIALTQGSNVGITSNNFDFSKIKVGMRLRSTTTNRLTNSIERVDVVNKIIFFAFNWVYPSETSSFGTTFGANFFTQFNCLYEGILGDDSSGGGGRNQMLCSNVRIINASKATKHYSMGCTDDEYCTHINCDYSFSNNIGLGGERIKRCTFISTKFNNNLSRGVALLHGCVDNRFINCTFNHNLIGIDDYAFSTNPLFSQNVGTTLIDCEANNNQNQGFKLNKDSVNINAKAYNNGQDWSSTAKYGMEFADSFSGQAITNVKVTSFISGNTKTSSLTDNNLTFSAPNFVNDPLNRFLTSGFEKGDKIFITGSSNNQNNKAFYITEITANQLTLSESRERAEYITNTLSFTGNQITDTNYGWFTQDFKAGDTVRVIGSALNDGTYTIANITYNVLTITTNSFVNETAGNSVRVTKRTNIVSVGAGDNINIRCGSQQFGVRISSSASGVIKDMINDGNIQGANTGGLGFDFINAQRGLRGSWEQLYRGDSIHVIDQNGTNNETAKFAIKGNSSTSSDIFSVDDIGNIYTVLPVYANNPDALAGGLVVGNLYKTATGEVRVVV
jgi:hypothetical protein